MTWTLLCRQFMNSIQRGDRTGRLMKFDESTKEVKVLLRGLAFSNEVALSKDRSFILVAETTTCRIMRLWLKGPNAGKSDALSSWLQKRPPAKSRGSGSRDQMLTNSMFLPSCLGSPDNIRRNSQGEFWVALHAHKGISARLLLSSTHLCNIALRLPLSFKQLHGLFVGFKPQASVMKLSKDAEVLEVLEDREGTSLRFISEVEDWWNELRMGSFMTPFVRIFDR